MKETSGAVDVGEQCRKLRSYMSRENLKPILEGIAAELQEQGVDLEATPALFRWWYPDNELIQYQLMIRIYPKGSDGLVVEGSDSVH